MDDIKERKERVLGALHDLWQVVDHRKEFGHFADIVAIVASIEGKNDEA